MFDNLKDKYASEEAPLCPPFQRNDGATLTTNTLLFTTSTTCE